MSGDIGKVGWIDMTTDDAVGVKDFYATVVGLNVDPVSMGDYEDFTMTMPDSGDPVAGICHARGSNAELPSGWLIYFVVADVEASAEACRQNGGDVIVEPRSLAGGKFCVIRDPGGSTAALYQN